MFEPYQTPASTAPAPNKTPAFFGFTRIPPLPVANLDPTHVATLKTGVQNAWREGRYPAAIGGAMSADSGGGINHL